MLPCISQALVEDTLLVVTDQRVIWIGPDTDHSGSIPLSQLKKAKVSWTVGPLSTSIALRMESGHEMSLGITSGRKEDAKRFARTVNDRLE